MAEVGGEHHSEPRMGEGARLWEAGQSPKAGGNVSVQAQGAPQIGAGNCIPKAGIGRPCTL